MTVACARYFATQHHLASFINFIRGLATRSDDVTRIAREALTKTFDEGVEPVEHEDLAEAEFRKYGGLVLETALTRSVDNFLNYLSDLLAIVFRTRPEALRSNEQVRVDFVLGYETMKELIDALADRRVDRLARAGLRELVEHFSERLGFDLFPLDGEFEVAIVAVESRNLLVHNRGVVNPTFLSRVPEPERYTLGESLAFDSAFVFDVLAVFDRAASLADNSAAEKWRVAQDVPHDDVVNYMPGES